MNDLVPGPASPDEDEGRVTFPSMELLNKMQYLRLSGDRVEHFLRNVIPLKLLIDQEANGFGHLTITECLDAILLLRTTGQTDNYDDLQLRRKPLNPIKSDIQKENEAYRNILEYMIQEFEKKSSGYRVWAGAIRILLDRIDNKQYD